MLLGDKTVGTTVPVGGLAGAAGNRRTAPSGLADDARLAEVVNRRFTGELRPGDKGYADRGAAVTAGTAATAPPGPPLPPAPP